MMTVLSTFSFATCSAINDKQPPKQEKQEWLKPDSASYSQLGKNLTTILFSAQKVECYSLKFSDKKGADDIEIEKNIIRDSLLAILNADQKAVLRYILLSPAQSYQDDTIRVRAPYSPVLEFVFYHKKMKQQAHVIMSLNDMTWTVIYDDKRQFNYNYTNKDAVTRFCKYFLIPK